MQTENNFHLNQKLEILLKYIFSVLTFMEQAGSDPDQNLLYSFLSDSKLEGGILPKCYYCVEHRS